ncbi:HAD family acid phosphatase [Streptomyces sp. DSM 41972]|uniref:HAD family acid phosphatase n=1 Tax=Streptomyces althioticus subsp. attaecolombicae TaxID=3075534 RepID=A0ABU3I2H6_9ACTN|nr:HAD family acid phosphatase [Streptomyces sp. DSM 41972]SCD68728.1 HAD superfamily, subfamily IIIB (Acid phosphatase) [Streptomyces sp. di50b]SCD73900.1 HAD superfamily, subfamily IIIB (Acid phosphatase) [Streptomyces sp. di188]
MRSRRPWLRRVSVTAVSATALVALAAPAEATPTATAPTAATAALPATAPALALAADVDHDTWQRDCRAVMDQALPYVKQRIADARPGEKQAIVLDIDNTALETDFGFSVPQPANEPVLEVARYAEERGVDLFFVTARPGIIYLPTEWNLAHAGYESSGLYVRNLVDLFRNVAEYKTAQRVDIERKGYTIIANIGNSATDLSGGHAERTFKLPDYDGRLS